MVNQDRALQQGKLIDGSCHLLAATLYIDNSDQIIQAANFGHAKSLLQQPKIPIWRELGVANEHEGNLYATVVAMAEKAADMISGRAALSPEDIPDQRTSPVKKVS